MSIALINMQIRVYNNFSNQHQKDEVSMEIHDISKVELAIYFGL